jgi:hypothetical protein
MPSSVLPEWPRFAGAEGDREDDHRREPGAPRQHPGAEPRILEQGGDGNAAPVVACPLANGGHVAELPACLAFGIGWRHPAVDQGPAPQVEVQPYLLGELVVEAIAAEECNDPAKELEHLSALEYLGERVSLRSFASRLHDPRDRRDEPVEARLRQPELLAAGGGQPLVAGAAVVH